MVILSSGILIVVAFIAGFFVGGKWKARAVYSAMKAIGSAEDKLRAIGRHL